MIPEIAGERSFLTVVKRSMPDQNDRNNLLQTITHDNQSFLLEQISSCMQIIATELAAANTAESLQRPYLKLKAEELIHYLFMGLAKRNDTPVQVINSSDAKMIYRVKEKILMVMDKPPKLKELAKFSGMSQSKLQRLFKQVFGNSIYNYHQSFRMQEAAYLIKEEKISVSEVGYRLGFSNLSHFSRIFETHIGLKPKKYAINSR